MHAHIDNAAISTLAGVPIVTILLLTNAIAWGATITAAASRMLVDDPFSPIYTIVWVAVTLQVH